MRAFIQALLQGEALGVSIGKILRNLAVDMRTRRRQAAEILGISYKALLYKIKEAELDKAS